jgi:hypothetical protein
MQIQTTVVNNFARVGTSVTNRLDERFFSAHSTDGLEVMQAEFRHSWLQELAQLTDLCERQMKMDLSWARDASSQLDPTRRWSPAVYTSIAQLRMGVEKADVTVLMDAFAKLRNLQNSDIFDAHNRIESILTECWEWDFVTTMRAYEPLGKKGEKTLVLPILGMDLSPHRDAISEAVRLIGEVDPRIKDEYDALVLRIKLFQGRVLRGETNTRVYGAVFFRLPPPRYHQVVYWVEHLVHEIAHLRLELLRVHDPLVNNDLIPRYQAPFRRDPRPMLGVYHATFVVARMMSVLRKLADGGHDAIYRNRFDCIQDKFEIGMNSLHEGGDFTRLGQRVVDSLREVAYG